MMTKMEKTNGEWASSLVVSHRSNLTGSHLTGNHLTGHYLTGHHLTGHFLTGPVYYLTGFS